MQICLRFPEFREKAVTFSYDDCAVFDRQLVEIMKNNGVKGTFNLISGRLDEPRSIRSDEVKSLYIDNGMEVAVHGKNHIFLNHAPLSEVYNEIYEDKKTLEKLTGGFVRGMAYANGIYNDDIVSIVKSLGIKYSRTCNDTNGFRLPNAWLTLGGTCRHTHPELDNLLKRFLDANPNQSYVKDPLLFYVWGHSYEFDQQNNWNLIEKFTEAVGKTDSVYKATNIEIYDYVKAFKDLEYSADCHKILNNSNIDIFAFIDNKNVLIKKNSITII